TTYLRKPLLSLPRPWSTWTGTDGTHERGRSAVVSTSGQIVFAPHERHFAAMRFGGSGTAWMLSRHAFGATAPIRTIAALLGRAASTVSREIKRNGGQEC